MNGTLDEAWWIDYYTLTPSRIKINWSHPYDYSPEERGYDCKTIDESISWVAPEGDIFPSESTANEAAVIRIKQRIDELKELITKLERRV